MDAQQTMAPEQSWLHDAPYPMLATDDDGRIRWANRAL